MFHFTLHASDENSDEKSDENSEFYTQKLSNSVLKTYEGASATGDSTGFRQVNVNVSKAELAGMLGSIVKDGHCDSFADDYADNIDDVAELKNYCRVFEVFPTEFGIATPYAVPLPK